MKQQKRLRDRTEKGKCTNKRERRVGLSTLVNPFHTEHDPPDVIGLDNNTVMLLANSRTITDDVTLTLHYISFEIFLPVPKCTHAHGSIMLPPRHPRVLARVTRWQLLRDPSGVFSIYSLAKTTSFRAFSRFSMQNGSVFT